MVAGDTEQDIIRRGDKRAVADDHEVGPVRLQHLVVAVDEEDVVRTLPRQLLLNADAFDVVDGLGAGQLALVVVEANADAPLV